MACDKDIVKSMCNNAIGLGAHNRILVHDFYQVRWYKLPIQSLIVSSFHFNSTILIFGPDLEVNTINFN